MMDVFDYLATAAEAVKEDLVLKETFNRVLQFGSATHQVRLSRLLEELNSQGAPEDLIKFVTLLKDDKLAQQFLVAINS